MKKKINFISKSETQTKEIGKSLGQEILNTKPFSNRAIIIGLKGNLGGGKTTFLQGLARGLGIREKVLSPTFVILKKFKIPKKNNKNFESFYHIDCYRLNKSKEILDLGLKKIAKEPNSIIALEWFELAKKELKPNIIIEFIFVDNNTRNINISS